MKSFAIKVTEEEIRTYLIEQFKQVELKDLYISSCDFRNFKNVIFHYFGDDLEIFEKTLSRAISNSIQKFYEEKLLMKIIKKNYFYLSEEEQENVLIISKRILYASKSEEDLAPKILEKLLYEYITQNKKMILEGIVIFRIKEYMEILDYIIELAVISYLNLIQY